jgi:N-acetylmuramoyl-L-alanine amidase
MASWLGPPVIKRDFGTNGGSWTRQPALIVIHSTEGTGTTDYQDGQVAPHFTLDPETGQIWQHISLAYAARALAHPSGTPETNRAGTVQIEVIGTCDPDHRGDAGWTYLPDMDAAMAGRVRKLLDMIHAAIPAIPLTTSVTFEPYPEPSYGGGHPRLSTSAFASAKGLIGHQHVPNNSHGDPGNIPISLILGSGDPVPTFIHVSIVEPYDVPAASWRWVTWDTIGGAAGGPSDKVCNAGSASIDIPGAEFVGTLILGARLPAGATLETRAVFGDLSGDGGAYAVKSALPPVVLRGGGDAYITDVRSAGVPGGQKLRYQVWASEPGELLKADLSLLYW